MKRRNLILGSATLAAFLASCAGTPTPDFAPNSVDYILIDKTARRVSLFQGPKMVAKYPMDLGFNPIGHKQKEGDGRTPEGRYYITYKNPKSAYHLSVYINYPNEQDKARAAAAGVSPGGEIFIHGGPTLKSDMGKKDWTAGCIAVTDKQIENIYRWTKIGAVVDIKP